MIVKEALEVRLTADVRSLDVKFGSCSWILTNMWIWSWIFLMGCFWGVCSKRWYLFPFPVQCTFLCGVFNKHRTVFTPSSWLMTVLGALVFSVSESFWKTDDFYSHLTFVALLWLAALIGHAFLPLCMAYYWMEISLLCIVWIDQSQKRRWGADWRFYSHVFSL